MSQPKPTPEGILIGELQCPKEFADFTLRRFDTLEGKIDKLTDQVGDAVLQFTTHTAKLEAREEASRQWRNKFKWGVTTVVALVAAAASVASVLH